MSRKSLAAKAARMIDRPREWIMSGLGVIGASKERLSRLGPPHWSAFSATVARTAKTGVLGVGIVDWMTGGFALVNMAYIAALRDRIDGAASLFLGYGACLAITIALVAIGGPERYPAPRSIPGKVVRWCHGLVREAYPFAMLAYFFIAVTRFDTALAGRDLDPVIRSFDVFLFGGVPANFLMARYDYALLSEIFHAAYVLYYVTIPALAIWLYVKDREGLREYVIVSMLIFYIACVTYALVPVVGARYDPATMALTEAYRHGPFTRIMAFIYRSSRHEGAAFPSTHAIQSAVIALIALRRAKPIAALLAVNAVLVWFATIYCGYHYVADLASALVFLAVLFPQGLKLSTLAAKRRT